MKTAKELELSLILKESHIQQLNLYVEQLENQINKAIDYIEENYTEYGNIESKWYYRTINADNVINILKGVDKE